MTANDNGYDNIFPPEVTTSQFELPIVREDITNELHMPLSSTIVLKRKKEMLYVLLVFGNGLAKDALVESGAYMSAIARSELDGIKQQTLPNFSKLTTLP